MTFDILELQTSKASYVKGESVVISGKVSRPSLLPVLIQVFNPNNAAYRFDKVLPQGDCSFKYSFLIEGSLGLAGNYEVKVTHEGSTKTVTIHYDTTQVGEKTVIIPKGILDSSGRLTFIPERAEINTGTTLTFINHDSATHWLVSGSPDGGTNGIFDTGLLLPNRYSTVIPRRSGTLSYYCTLHPNEVGILLMKGSTQLAREEKLLPPQTATNRISPEGLQHFSETLQRTAKLEQHFSPDVIQELSKEYDDLRNKRIRKITTVFWDIRRFTKLCEILKASPPLVSGFLQEYYDMARASIFAFGGGLDKFQGDGVMGFFGIPLRDESGRQDAISAAAAATSLREEFEVLKEKWLPIWKGSASQHMDIALKCAMETGDVIYGDFGTEKNSQFTEVGTSVNIASRLVNEAQSGEILLSNQTSELLKDMYELEPLGPKRLKNIEFEIDVYRLGQRKSR